jgi:phosphoribosyl 1,2-cyclic phosphate phosphodiesterase
LPNGNLLIDTPPDLHTQLVRENVGIVHAVAYTHEHADHLFGMDDLRLFQFYLGHPVPVYCEEPVERRIRLCFDYAFTESEQTHTGAVPAIDFHRIHLAPFHTLGHEIVPVRLNHGPRFDVLGFRIGNVAYCTDTNGIPEESRRLLAGLDVLVLDALRPQPHVTHFSIEQAVEMSRLLGAKRTFFTHISCRLDHDATNAWLPPTMKLAYDGLSVPLT